MISDWDRPLGEKSDPPFPPPIGSVVSAFLNVCSNPKNFKEESDTEGWKRIPPLYGPMAPLNCTRYPMFTCTWPLSSVHGTRKVKTRSGSTIRSTIAAFSNSGCWLYTSSIDTSTSFTACKNSDSPGCLISRRVITSFTFIRLIYFHVIVSGYSNYILALNDLNESSNFRIIKSTNQPPFVSCRNGLLKNLSDKGKYYFRIKRLFHFLFAQNPRFALQIVNKTNPIVTKSLIHADLSKRSNKRGPRKVSSINI